MSVAKEDIHFYHGNDPDGGDIDTGSEIVTGVQGNLFADITVGEAADAGERRKKYFARNEHASETLAAAVARLGGWPRAFTPYLGLALGNNDDNDSSVGDLNGAGSVLQTVKFHSDGADARFVQVVGEDGDGVRIESSDSLDGVNDVTLGTQFVRVLLVYIDSSDPNRTVTIYKNDVEIGHIMPNKRSTWWWMPEAEWPFALGDITSMGNVGMWLKITWLAGLPGGGGFTFIPRVIGDGG